MTLPVSGPISMFNVATELGITAPAISLNHPWVRALAQIPSGAISMFSLLGKSGNFAGIGNVIGGAIQMPMPFFGGGTNGVSEVEQTNNGNGTYTIQLFLSPAPPVYTGNVVLFDSTTGQTVVLTYVSPGNWQNLASQQILVPGNNSFTLYPHT